VFTLTVPTTGHSFGSDWENDDLSHWHECSCGEASDEASHTPGVWIVDVAATATTDGSRHKECTTCGFITEAEVIPATGGNTTAVDEVIDNINSLPDPDAVSDTDTGFVDDVIEATNSYNNLSDDEKAQIPQSVKDKLAQAQAKAGAINHKSGNATLVSALPWNIRLVVTLTPATNAEYAAFFGKLTGKKLLVLYDIKLINTLTGEIYELPAGQTVTIELAGLNLNGVKGIAIAHEKKDGTIEYLIATVNGNKLTFTTSSCSLFGVTADADKEDPQNPDPGKQGGNKKDKLGDTGKKQTQEQGGKQTTPPLHPADAGDMTSISAWMLLTLLATGMTATVIARRKT